MAIVVNLRTRRKQRDRDVKRQSGAEASCSHQVTSSVADRARAENVLERRRLESHRREDGISDDDDR